jgi:hypothetical protein
MTNGWSGTLASNIPDNGTYTLNLPNVSSFSSAEEFSQYFKNTQIKIEIAANEINMYASSNLFSIVPPPTLTTPGIATTPAVPATPVSATVNRGVKVVLVENPGGACKTSSTGQCTSNTPGRWGNLVFGIKNNDAVKAYQMILQNAGYLPASAKADGNFGPATQAAVRALQKNSGITQTGNIDATTLGVLAPLIKAQSLIKPHIQVPPNAPVGLVVYGQGASCSVWSPNGDGSYSLITYGITIQDSVTGAFYCSGLNNMLYQ